MTLVPLTGPAAQLDRLLAALADGLPGQLEGLLDAERFASGCAALSRLADPAHRRPLAALDLGDVEWLLAELRARWTRVGESSLAPCAWIEPSEGEGGEVRLVVHVDGLEGGWSVAWTGAEPHAEDPGVAWVRTSGSSTAAARVMGRGPQGRVILSTTWVRDPEGGDAGGAGSAPT